MQVDINGTIYELGNNLEYRQINPDGAFQDKLKYRLVQQNNYIIQVIPVIVREMETLRQILDGFVAAYIWAADDDTIMASDDDTILTFYTYFSDAVTSLSERVAVVESNVQQLADQSVIVYKEDS